MTLDANDWDRVSVSHGVRWGLWVSNGYRYVVSLGEAPKVFLARLLLGAGPGRQVRCIQQHRAKGIMVNTNLKRANLRLV